MAVKLLLTVGLVFLIGRSATTEVLTDDTLSPAEAPQQAQNSAGDQTDNEVLHLVETLKNVIEEEDRAAEEGASLDEPDADPPVEEMEQYGNEVELGTDGLIEEEEREMSQELEGETSVGVAVEEAVEEVRHVSGGGLRQARVCEHQTLTISCPAGRQIRVVSALYGRTSRDFCPHSQIRTTSCQSTNSLTLVRTSCQGRSSCSVRASNSVFGDPCRGTFKYLEVRYTCTGRPTTACAGWTRWYDRDNPSATGDWEVLSHLRQENPGQICAAPSGIQARVKGSNTPASRTGRQFYRFNPQVGFVCRNNDNGRNRCLDYEVRFWCP
ncbi:uncharacterized protein LOC144914196 isoform X1 [Branchiostoma floridae x Branchiostoma belcheri]